MKIVRMLLLTGLVAALLVPATAAQAGLPSGVIVTFTAPNSTGGVPYWTDSKVSYGIAVSNSTSKDVWVCGSAVAYINNKKGPYNNYVGHSAGAIFIPAHSGTTLADPSEEILVSSKAKDTRGLRKGGPNGALGGWTTC